jgi:Reverse transcriptase (RNA-dependent DNA polymerase)
LEVRNTFLQGTLEEKVYMRLPLSHEKEQDRNLVCKLIKLIYELKQSPRAWYEKLSSHLTSYNFNINNADHSLFVKHDHIHIIVVLVYVDDIIIIGSNEGNLNQIKKTIEESI